MSKNKSMDGLYSDERGQQVASTRALGYPFYVPGERHENLPGGGFAGKRGMHGTPNYSIRYEPTRFEFATGSDGQFGRAEHADFGHGAHCTQAGSMGWSIADIQSAAKDAQAIAQQGQAYAQEGQALYQAGKGLYDASNAPALTPVPSPAQLSTISSSPIFATKAFGIPVIVLVAGVLGAYFVYKKMK
jgi:hypothetical protein